MKFFKKTDIIIITAILAVSAAIWAVYGAVNSGNKALKAEIYYYNELIAVIDMNTGEDKRFSFPQNKNVVFHLDKEGNISFENSDCPDKICIKTGKLNKAGQSAACLPNGFVMKIVPAGGRSPDDVDIR